MGVGVRTYSAGLSCSTDGVSQVTATCGPVTGPGARAPISSSCGKTSSSQKGECQREKPIPASADYYCRQMSSSVTKGHLSEPLLGLQEFPRMISSKDAKETHLGQDVLPTHASTDVFPLKFD